MKMSIFLLAAFALLVGIFVVYWPPSMEKDASANSDSNEDLNDVFEEDEDYVQDIISYRQNVLREIEQNNKMIAELEAKLEERDNTDEGRLIEGLIIIDNKNDELKSKIENYKAQGKEHWEKFRNEFMMELEDLEEVFKDVRLLHTR